MSDKRASTTTSVTCYILALLDIAFAIWYVASHSVELASADLLPGYCILYGLLASLWVVEGFAVFFRKDMNFSLGLAIGILVLPFLLGVIFYISFSTGLLLFSSVSTLAVLLFMTLNIVAVLAFPWSGPLVRRILPLLRDSLERLNWVRDHVTSKLNSEDKKVTALPEEVDSQIAEVAAGLDVARAEEKLSLSSVRKLFVLSADTAKKTRQFFTASQETLEKDLAGLLSEMKLKNGELEGLLPRFFDTEERDVLRRFNIKTKENVSVKGLGDGRKTKNE